MKKSFMRGGDNMCVKMTKRNSRVQGSETRESRGIRSSHGQARRPSESEWLAFRDREIGYETKGETVGRENHLTTPDDELTNVLSKKWAFVDQLRGREDT